MATVKINCPKCGGYGLTGESVESVCSQCKGIGTISVSDASTLATISSSSEQPLIVTTAKAVPTVVIKAIKKENKL